MNQVKKANRFTALHIAGSPVVLYNIWDAGSASTVAKAGASAIATGSWSVAAAQGYSDGEQIPLSMVLQITERITQTVDLPVTIDFEGGYSTNPEDNASNVKALIHAGAIGINFEDQVVGQQGLHSVADQVSRIQAIRQAADESGIPLFINARTDLFLKAASSDHEAHIDEAIERASAYADAGASGFFIPGLMQADMIGKICESTSLPVNIMMKPGMPSIDEAAALGVSRISYGPGPYATASSQLLDTCKTTVPS